MREATKRMAGGIGVNLGAVVLALAAMGCSGAPIYDWHTGSGEPVRGAVPYLLSGCEEHHCDDYREDYRDREECKSISLIRYPIGK